MDEEAKQRKERMKEYRRRYREKHGLKPHNRRVQNIVVAIGALCLVGIGSFFAAQSRADAMVTLDGQSVQGMSLDDVDAYIQQHQDTVKGKTLALKGQDVEETLDLDDLGATIDTQYIHDELYLTGRRGTPWERVADVVSTLQHGKNVPLAMTVDQDKLQEAVQKVVETYGKDPQNAYAYPLNDNTSVAIAKEKAKIDINSTALTDNITAELHKGTTNTVDVPITNRTEADIKAEDLKDIDHVLAYYTTHFDDSNPDRNDNIRLAQEKLNHALVPSKTDFSFNKYVGTRTKENGYKDAPVYFDNKLVPDAGGGVCQVSTTLFNAVLRAGLFIASRAPHFAPAAYVPVGLDATVADGSLDFAFTNPFSHPVYIFTIAGKNAITTYILGNHADLATVTFQTAGLANLPHKVIHKHDDKVTADTVQQEGYDGHNIVIHRSVAYADGDKYGDDIASYYAPNDEIILTSGPDAEETVQTSDLQAQDILINAPHDMYEAVMTPAADAAPADGGDSDAVDDSGDDSEE